MAPDEEVRRGGAVHIVVVDDVCRFALHLWSYLSGVPGFGIGSVPTADDHGKFFWADPRPPGNGPEVAHRGEPRSLDSPDGRWSVWWVEARDGIWKPQLKKIFEKLPSFEGARFLIDVRGPVQPGSGSLVDEKEKYGPDLVRAEILEKAELLKLTETREDRKAFLRKIVFVSSYKKRWKAGPEGFQPQRIWEKTARTFEYLKRTWSLEEPLPAAPGRDRPEPEASSDESRACRQILVTGAGFDIGGWEPVRGLGIVGTAQVLRDTLEAVDPRSGDPSSGDRPWPKDEEEQSRAKRELAFPVPKRYFADRGEPAPKRFDTLDWHHFIEAAEEGDLDTYWENLLRLELARVGEDDDGHPFDKVRAAAREHELREAFRAALVQYDWGFTRQTLDALEIETFEAWLTTNYSRISNRGSDLLESHRQLGAGHHWRYIATSNEATLLLRKLLHEESEPERLEAAATRYLFKLHGDIPHVTTMALAGSDKEIFSPLSMPIDSLHWLYTTAQKYLEGRLRPAGNGKAGDESEGPKVVWHIVGHGLKDKMLVDLMVRVCLATEPERHRFVITGKMAKDVRNVDDPGHILAGALQRCGAQGWQILRLDATALDLMAHMKADRRWETGDLTKIAQWAESFGEVRLRLPA